MSPPLFVQYASRTDVGMRRAANQDSFIVRLCSGDEEWSRCGHLFVVADGMGGHAVGDLASRITIETLPHSYFKREADTIQDRVRGAITAANKAINDRGRENREFEGMGTTCSVLSLSEVGAVVGHVGDSRVYRVRRNKIEQLTFDHSLQWEMIRIGRATAENVELFHPRNVITRCLGPDLGVQIDIEGPFSVEAGDYFVLCSDGLTNHVTDSEIGQVVASLPPAESSRLLINLANFRGGSDNSTVVVVRIDSYPGSTAAITESHADQLQRRRSGINSKSRQLGTWRIVLAAASVVCLLAGVGLGIAGNLPAAAVLMIAAVLAWLISRRMNHGSDPASSGGEAGSSSPWHAPDSCLATTPAGEQPTMDHSDSPRSAFLRHSPYRVVEAVLSPLLLGILGEVQSGLIKTAKESDWKVAFDELTNLSRQAAQAEQSGKLDRAIKARSKAIDLLMREFYIRSRSG